MENSGAGSIRVGMWDGATTGDPAAGGGLFDEYFYASIQFTAWVTSATINGDGLAHAYRMGLLPYNNAGAARVYSTQFYIEDIGPVSQAANPPLQPASVWQTATYQNGWTTWDAGGTRPAQFRLVGDEVEMRGCIKAGTIAWGTAAFTLPAGYRPPTASLSWPVNSLGGVASCDVFSDGRVSFAVNTTGSMPAAGWVYIDPVRFSVTP